MPSLISLFAGAGGLDIGLEEAGFSTITATDVDARAVDSLRVNRDRRIPVRGRPGETYLNGANILQADVADLQASDLRPPHAGAGWVPDLLVGGPPCQPFSSAGKQLSVLEDRGKLFEHFVRLAAELQPRTILFENVRGLVTSRGAGGEPGEVFLDVKQHFESVGYSTSFSILNAADYGAAQRRVRLFMIATRDTSPPPFPPATHSKHGSTDLFSSVKKWVSLGELLDSLPPPNLDEIVRPGPALASQLSIIPSGSGLKSPGRAEPSRPAGHWGYKQGTFIADLDLPARTVTTSASQDWIRERDGQLRRLTLKECASLQGFPDQWVFTGPSAAKFRQVGNAVPSVFGRVLGRAIADNTKKTPRSEPIPKFISDAIEYTKRDHIRNSSARPRTNAFIDQIGSGRTLE